jgi:cyclase
VGDPINAIRIFNEKEVDELIILDITATIKKKKPPFDLISQLASECFMPFAYGGGIRDLEDIRRLFRIGVEKVAINSYAVENPKFTEEASRQFGSQSIIVALDVKRKSVGQYEIFIQGGRKATGLDPVDFVTHVEKMGAGEILINSIERDGTGAGYDLELIRKVSDSVNIPVIACGGAGKIEDLAEAITIGHASAVTAGSLFVYHGKRRAVLINFPTKKELELLLEK